MENILTGFIVLFLLLFSVLSFSEASLRNQRLLASAERRLELHIQERHQTLIQLSEVSISNDGRRLEAWLNNLGNSRLSDLRRWDIIVQYQDDSPSAIQRILYVPFTSQNPLGTQWTSAGIFLNDTPEQYERDILNPSERLRLLIQLEQGMARGSIALIHLSLNNGVSVQTQVRRNQLAVLDLNQTLSVTENTSTVIDHTHLSASDPDGDADAIRFSVVSPPNHGTLNLNEFSQADLQAGRLSYSATSIGSDSFSFELSDGYETSGTFVFTIDILP